MEDVLDKVEERVLGVLIEKGLTTSDYYPLTLNSLTTGCNQKSNRKPVVDFDDKTVVRALDSLREKELIRRVSGADQRVPMVGPFRAMRARSVDIFDIPPLCL